MTQPAAISSGVRLSHLLAGFAEVNTVLDPEITSLTLDSRKVSNGGLFLACSGGRHHGLEFLSQALEQGAAAVLWEPDSNWTVDSLASLTIPDSVVMLPVCGLGKRVSMIAGRFFRHPDLELLLIGITGTNGKSSCTQYLARVLAPDLRCGTIGTLGIGFPDALMESNHTTPDPVTLQAALADFRDAGADAVAMEVSSHALDQERVAALNFDVAVFTNLSRDHLDYHASFSAYGEAKRRLFRMAGLKVWVINLDDAFGQALVSDAPVGVTIIGYGQGADRSFCDRVSRYIWASEVHSDDSGMRIDLESSWGNGSISTRLLGRFNVSNLLAVSAVLLQQGISLAQAVERLAGLATVPGRMERFGGGDQPLVIVDYAHTPDALQQVLSASRGHARGHLLCVFGCGGDRDSGKRPEMAAIAETLADQVFVTDDNPRTEDGNRIVADILSGMREPGRARVERDRATAIRLAITSATAGDVVLVAGKGHENYQQVGGVRLPFDDREQVRRVLLEATQ
ncbi:MAG: UDP-N-acetylmuramoyl-L-alanyl-D-glutamate--2,6-diaminopimelate ligase [Gammaproteobacteria bacterium]|nr:UDP-N-acetylmuramoyl-L-alanyl-D-glutamate--2,6-diaminopimelate ligase [Gammaproteobacteria bacterium]MCB1849179.1 UDP-N-acetylmuramoyl-L-alanyl-D-glutamate--2,6-diaminopimelate ligase [Gammaproteobacteria bacterium]